MYVDIESLHADSPIEHPERPAILFVDDDPCLLDGLRRQLRRKFRVRTALGGVEGLDTLTQQGPFAVVVSDLQMPGMDGVQFLTKVRALSPLTVRIMFTGRADISTAMAAINQGNIFRFLVKPCAPVVLEKVLEAALDQYKLLASEQLVIRETLLGCVQVLVEVLSIVQPEAFSRATRVRRHARDIASALGLDSTWELEAAAMLSQIGWITLPPDLLTKAIAGPLQTQQEQSAFLAHAGAAARILEKIPRFGVVARIVERQHLGLLHLPSLDPSDQVAVGGQILKAALDFDGLLQQGLRPEVVLGRMKQERDVYLPQVLAAMTVVAEHLVQAAIHDIPLSQLSAGMILEQDLLTESGGLLLSKGEDVTTTFIERLSTFGYGLAPDHMLKIRSSALPQLPRACVDAAAPAFNS